MKAAFILISNRKKPVEDGFERSVNRVYVSPDPEGPGQLSFTGDGAG
jgi:hypothetical protein